MSAQSMPIGFTNPIVYPDYVNASHVVTILNSNDETLETGFSYTVVEYNSSYAIGIINDEGQYIGEL